MYNILQYLRSPERDEVTACHCGPGYATPMDAMKHGPREKLLYVICIQPNKCSSKSDLLATVDIDPESPTYCQIIHRLRTGRPEDELHHSGWNVCSSCYNCYDKKRNKLLLPALGSDRIFVVDTGANPRAPTLFKTIEAEEMHKYNCSAPHTSHCLPNGEVVISTLGDCKGNGKCEFVRVDTKTYSVVGTWTKGEVKACYNYDFWYQPYYDIWVSSEWANPKDYKLGFDPSKVDDPSVYGRHLNFHSWTTHELIASLDLGPEGVAPFETRFLHDPKECQGYVGCPIYSTLHHFYLDEESDKWCVEQVLKIKRKKVTGWISDYLEGTIADILISLDDKYLYLSNWLHGDVRQYDISDRRHPKLTGQIFLGGKILSDSPIRVIEDEELDKQPDPVVIKGTRVYGGPNMLQLSLDGKRLYVSFSLYSPWERQIYPDVVENGSTVLQLYCDTENGGLCLNEDFIVDFGTGEDGPLLTHDMRYPGGDCTSDIWLVPECKSDQKS